MEGLNINQILEQEPHAVALVFKKYGIKAPVDSRSLASAILTKKEPFVKDLVANFSGDESNFCGCGCKDCQSKKSEYSNLDGKKAVELYGKAREKVIDADGKIISVYQTLTGEPTPKEVRTRIFIVVGVLLLAILLILFVKKQ